jgi:predicted transcriptional regulator
VFKLETGDKGMDLQRCVLKTFKEYYGNLTIREIAALTGIQYTRVFRLFNGSEMKLGEYEAFKRLNDVKGLENQRVFELAQLAANRLTRSALDEIENLIERKLTLWNYQNGARIEEQNQLMAA